MTSLQVQEWLREGIAAAHAGDNERAYHLFLKVIDVDEYNEQAWLWLSSVVETDADREVCLENVLAINPDNKVAKAGLVHLRSRVTQPLPEQIGPEPEIPRPAVFSEAPFVAAPTEPRAEAPAFPSEEGDTGRDVLTFSPTLAEEKPEPTVDWEAPESQWWEHKDTISLERLVVPALVVLGLVAAALALAVLLGTGLLDPVRRDYIRAMRPVLEAHGAWWDGPQGALSIEMNSLCGPEAEGWRNRDVLQACSRYPSVECAHLTAHCNTDVEEMRQQVAKLAHETEQRGKALMEVLEGVRPPADITSAHTHFLACLQSELAEAARAGQLAGGDTTPVGEVPSACQMFPTAEEEIRAYVGIP